MWRNRRCAFLHAFICKSISKKKALLQVQEHKPCRAHVCTRGARRVAALNMSYCRVFLSIHSAQVVRMYTLYNHVHVSEIHTYYMKAQLIAGKYSILCQFCENIRDSKTLCQDCSRRGKYAKICESMRKYAPAFWARP